MGILSKEGMYLISENCEISAVPSLCSDQNGISFAKGEYHKEIPQKGLWYRWKMISEDVQQCARIYQMLHLKKNNNKKEVFS